MASIISAGTTSGTALNMTGDTSGQLQLATNGSTTALTIDTSQNVGIGGTPVAKFDVNNGALGRTLLQYNGTSFNYFDVDNHYWRNAASTDLMRLTSSGNLLFNSGYGSVAVAYGCRAWVNFNGTGTVAIRGSGNVTSITDNNVGSYTINFTTALVDANYSVSGIPRNTQTYAQIQVLAISIAQATAPTTSALAITVTGQNDGALRTAIDSDYVCVSVFR